MFCLLKKEPNWHNRFICLKLFFFIVMLIKAVYLRATFLKFFERVSVYLAK